MNKKLILAAALIAANCVVTIASGSVEKPLSIVDGKNLPLEAIPKAFKNVKKYGYDFPPSIDQVPLKGFNFQINLEAFEKRSGPKLFLPTSVVPTWGKCAERVSRFSSYQLRITMNQDLSKIINGFVVPVLDRKGNWVDARLAQVTVGPLNIYKPLERMAPGDLGHKLLHQFQAVTLHLSRMKSR